MTEINCPSTGVRPIDAEMKVTVFPAIAGGFPPASFWTTWDSLSYIRDMQDHGAPCGLCACPASSYYRISGVGRTIDETRHI